MRAFVYSNLSAAARRFSARLARALKIPMWLLRFQELSRAQSIQRRRGCSKTKWLCLPPIGCAPHRPSCAPHGPFLGRHLARRIRILRSCVASARTRTLKASGCWGSLKSPGNPAKMALSAEDKYRFALRVIGFACTTFYVFIYGAAPESETHASCLHGCHARRAPQATATSSTARPATRGRRRTTTSRATQL